MHNYDKAHYDLYIHRKRLTQAVQDMLVTIWLREKERMFADKDVEEYYEREIEEIQNIERLAREPYADDDDWEILRPRMSRRRLAGQGMGDGATLAREIEHTMRYMFLSPTEAADCCSVKSYVGNARRWQFQVPHVW